MANNQDYWEKIFGRPPGEPLVGPTDPLTLGPEQKEGPIPGDMPWENIFGRPPGQELEPVEEPSFFKKALGAIGGFAKKELPAFLMQDPGLRRAVFAGVPKPEEEERPLPTIGPVSPEHVKFVEKYGLDWEMATRPRSYYRIAQETWSRDPNVNYWSEKISNKAVPIAMIIGAPEVAGYLALYEIFQQMKNIGFAVAEKTKYDPLENRRLSEAIPGIKDAPWWVRLATDVGETGLDIVAAAITGKAISFGTFKFGFNKWQSGMRKAGVPKETLDAMRDKFNLIGKDLAAFNGLNRNIKNVFAKFKIEPTHRPPGETVPQPYTPTAAERAAGIAAGRPVPEVVTTPGIAAAPAVRPTPPVPTISGRRLPGPAPFVATPKPEVIPPLTDPVEAAMATVRSGITPEMDEPTIKGFLPEAPRFPSTVRTVMPLGTPEQVQALERVRQYIPESGILPDPPPPAAPQPAINIKAQSDGSIDITTKPLPTAQAPAIVEDDRLFQAQAADLAERLKAGAQPSDLADEAHKIGIPVKFLPKEITEEGMAKKQADIFRQSELETERQVKALRGRTLANYEVEGVGAVPLPVRIVSGRRWPKPVPYQWFRVLEYTSEGISPIKGEMEEYQDLDNRLKGKGGPPADEVADALGYESTSELYAALKPGPKPTPETTYSEEDVLPVPTTRDLEGQVAAEEMVAAEDIDREIARGISEMEELAARPELAKKLTPDARSLITKFIPDQFEGIDPDEVLVTAAQIAKRNKEDVIKEADVNEALDREMFVETIKEDPDIFILKQDAAMPSMKEDPFKRLFYYGHKWFNDIQRAQDLTAGDKNVIANRAVESAKQVEQDFGVDLWSELPNIRTKEDLSRGLRNIWRDRELGRMPVLPGAELPAAPTLARKKWPAVTTPVQKIVPKFGKPEPKQLGLIEKEPGQLEIPIKPAVPAKSKPAVKKPAVPPKKIPTAKPKPDKLQLEAEKVLARIQKPAVEKPKLPKGKVSLVKVSVKTPLNDIEKLGEIPEDRIQNIKDYAKKLGIENKLTVGDPFVGKYGEILSPAQQEIFMKEVIRDVKTKSKEEWKKWTDVGTDEKDLYSGLPVGPELKKHGAEISKWLQIEPQFKHFGADRTGLALKALHPRTNAVLLQVKNQIKKIIKQFPDLSDSDWQRLLFIASAPRKHFGKMTPAEREKFYKPATAIRKYFDNWGREMQRKGIIDDLWPQSAIKYMKAEISTFHENLKKPGLSNERGKKIRDKINQLESAIEFLQRSGTKYVHIPRLWMQAWWDSDPATGVKVISEFFRKRKSLDLEAFATELIEDGKIKPIDLDVRRVMAAYGHQVGLKSALADAFRAAKTDKMIVLADEAPKTFQSFDTKRYPSLRGYKGHPALTAWLERNLTKQNFMHPKLGAFLGTIKVLQFYNPLFLPMYDAIQYFWLGILSPWKTPGAFRDAVISMRKKDQGYWNMHYWAGFSTPFTPGWKQFDKQIRDLINSDHFWQRFKNINPYRWSWELAWWGDNLLRLTTYHHQIRSGATPMEAAQIAAKLHADYAAIPPATRKVINKVLFTPSFRISMLSAQAEMTKNLAKMLFKGKKEAMGDTGAKLPPGDLFEEPIDGSIPEGPGRSKRYQRAMGKALIGLVGGMLLREWFMTKVLGYKKDRFGLRYSKDVISEGEEKELVQYMSSPDNVLMRYWHRFRTLANEPDKIKGFIDRAKWDFHPFLQLVYEVIQNADPAGEPIYRPGLESSAKIGTDILEYSLKRIFRMLEVVSEDTPGKRKKAIDAMHKDMGKMAHFFRWFTLPYLRNRAEKRMMWRMNFTVKEFQRIMREKPFETEEGAEKAVDRLQDFIQKMMDDIEEEKKK